MSNTYLHPNNIRRLESLIEKLNEYLAPFDKLQELLLRLDQANEERRSILKEIKKIDISSARYTAMKAVNVRRNILRKDLAAALSRHESRHRAYTVQPNGQLMRTFTVPVNQTFENINIGQIYSSIADILENAIGRNRATVKFTVESQNGVLLSIPLTERPIRLYSYADVPELSEVTAVLESLYKANAINNNDSNYNDPRNILINVVIQIFYPNIRGRGFVRELIDRDLLVSKSIVVPTNTDDNCFQHALFITLNHENVGLKMPKSSLKSYSAKKLVNPFFSKFKDLTGPTDPCDPIIEDYEIALQTNIHIYEYPCTSPLRKSKYAFEQTAHILYYTNEEYAHYCAIVKPEVYLKSETGKTSFHCKICNKEITMWNTSEQYHEQVEKHTARCTASKIEVTYKYPQAKYNLDKVSGKDEIIPYSIYYDFEATTDGAHKAFSFGMALIKTNPEKSELVAEPIRVFSANETELLEKFFSTLMYYKNIIYDQILDIQEIHGYIPSKPAACEDCHTVTPALVKDHHHYLERNNFRAWICHKCNTSRRVNKPIRPKYFEGTVPEACMKCNRKTFETLVPRYDSNSGKYLGHYHTTCIENIGYYMKSFRDKDEEDMYAKRVIPVIAHNASGYDNNFLMRHYNLPFPMSCLMKNTETLISWTAGPFQFKDSMRFWNTSLKNAFDSLKSTPIINSYKQQHPETAALLNTKMVFPYEFFKADKIAEQLQQKTFPAHEDFYSKLNKENISAEDYQEAKNYFDKHCASLQDFIDLYQTSDVLMLADAIENLRRNVYSKFEIEPLHYHSAPGFSFACFIKHVSKIYPSKLKEYFPTNAPESWEIQSLDESSMEFFNQVRGGISVAIKRHATAADGELMYYDANSLYPTAMQGYMPYDSFQEESAEGWSLDRIAALPDEDITGHQFIVDVDEESYSQEFQDFWSDMPPIVNHMIPCYSHLSQYQKKGVCSTKYKPTKKLLGTFLPQKNYTIHYRLLKFLINHGFKCKIRRVLSFRQIPFLKTFVQQCATLRTTDPEAKVFWKLIMNSCYGKFLQNEEKQSTSVMSSNLSRIRMEIDSPVFLGLTHIAHNTYVVHRARENVSLRMCRQVGTTILDDSKLIMFQHYVNVKKFDPTASLIYTDTDSHVWQFTKGVTRDQIYQNLKFDHSSLPKNNPYYSKENEAKLGYVKDEHPSMTEFVALQAKVYSLRDGAEEVKHGKGIPNKIVQKELTFGHFKEVLFGATLDSVEFTAFRRNNHQISTAQMKKKNITNFDDKRYILEDGISTLPYGHYKIIPAAEVDEE